MYTVHRHVKLLDQVKDDEPLKILWTGTAKEMMWVRGNHTGEKKSFTTNYKNTCLGMYVANFWLELFKYYSSRMIKAN